ncbi:MAG: hypothetical protein IJ560_03320 [Alphaproteobacteria bacterium]|nr:hypothetical protein [Alphaproteobacteria bacterium]
MKRLFLFAGYDTDGRIDASIMYYVRALSEQGDVVLCMDSDCKISELNKLKPYVLHAMAHRHGEYDFGSYKRAYIWAHDNLALSDYDVVYMINDSVYGPLYYLLPYLERMESADTDAFGIVENPKREHPHIQSWFIGMRKNVFLSDWFNTFITSVTKQPSKGAITALYEHGFTRGVEHAGGKWMCLYSVPGRGVYNNIKKLYRKKMPFMKKVAFTRHNGEIGPQINYVLRQIDTDLRIAIIENAQRVYGRKYIDTILHRGWISAKIHGAIYGIKKLFRGQL